MRDLINKSHKQGDRQMDYDFQTQSAQILCKQNSHVQKHKKEDVELVGPGTVPSRKNC